jgi:hypothetical protein
MKKLHKFAFISLVGLGLSTVSSLGQIVFDYSYTFASDGNTVSGQLEGTYAGGGLVDFTSVLSLYYDGIQDPDTDPISAASVAVSPGNPLFGTPAVASFNANNNDFAFVQDDNLIFAMVPSDDTIDSPNGALATDILGDLDAPTDPGNWSLVPAPCAVPEASTVFAGAMLLLPLGVSMVRMVRKSKTA